MFFGLALAAPPDRGAVDTTLDALHQAATDADAATYFGLFTDDAVFIGTDAEEVWTLPAFRAFAAPHFESAPAWAYTSVSRDVRFGRKGRTAWFHESLEHASYGAVRGSGVLSRVDGAWRVSQYVLSFPVPNAVANEVVATIAAHSGGGPTATLPTPYTADQIRASCAPGTSMVTHTTQGGHTTGSRTTFSTGDVEGTTFRVEALDADGAAVGEAGEHEATWVQLRDHASFPTSATWADASVTVPAGTFSTRRYTVPTSTGTAVFWFAPAYPGPPVKVQLSREGAVVSETVLVSDTRVPAPL